MREGIGNHLLVIRGDHRGQIGEIVQVKQLGCGLINYCMTFGDNKDISYEIPSEDCRDYVPGSINLEAPFDITSYLSTTTMKEVALEIYRSKVEMHVNEVLENRRSSAQGSYADQVLKEIAKKFIDENFQDMKPDVIKRCKEVINSDKPFMDDEDCKPFADWLQWYLKEAAGKYIETHREEIWSIMENNIIDTAKKMATDDMTSILSDKLRMTFRASLKEIAEKLEAK